MCQHVPSILPLPFPSTPVISNRKQNIQLDGHFCPTENRRKLVGGQLAQQSFQLCIRTNFSHFTWNRAFHTFVVYVPIHRRTVLRSLKRKKFPDNYNGLSHGWRNSYTGKALPECWSRCSFERDDDEAVGAVWNYSQAARSDDPCPLASIVAAREAATNRVNITFLVLSPRVFAFFFFQALYSFFFFFSLLFARVKD